MVWNEQRSGEDEEEVHVIGRAQSAHLEGCSSRFGKGCSDSGVFGSVFK